MQKYFAIAAGGFLGAVLRYLLEAAPFYGFSTHFPLATLFINITGSFLIAVILTIALTSGNMDEVIKLGVTTGFCGAFTTFSTFCNEFITLLNHGSIITALVYMAVSPVMGLLAVWFGVLLGRKAVVRPGSEDIERSDFKEEIPEEAE